MSDHARMPLGHAVTVAAEQCGLSHEQVAVDLGVSWPSYLALLNGSLPVDVALAGGLARVLGGTPEEWRDLYMQPHLEAATRPPRVLSFDDWAAALDGRAAWQAEHGDDTNLRLAAAYEAHYDALAASLTDPSDTTP